MESCPATGNLLLLVYVVVICLYVLAAYASGFEFCGDFVESHMLHVHAHLLCMPSGHSGSQSLPLKKRVMKKFIHMGPFYFSVYLF